MTTIDHRILIPVPQAVVWDYISKLPNLMRWQVDLKNVAMLTSKGEGVGTRWRETHEGGREFVAEIRAWYDGLGYQYVYVERPPFKYAMGTVRLQEIAEGTIVQWTLEYETGGVLSGVRNALGMSRQLDATVQGSLKKLYLQLKTDRARSLEPGIETKALMRDAPDAEARSQYKPRHPSAVNESDMPVKAPVSTGAVIFEPPLNQDDTRPTRAIAAITDEQIAEAPPTKDRASLQEPDFISTIPNLSEDTSPVRDTLGNAQPIDTDAVRRELDEPEPVLTTIVIPEPEPTDSQRLMDTSNMSIWEIFGVPRPSETGEMRKVVVEPPPIVADAPPAGKPKTGRTKKVTVAEPIEDSAPIDITFAPIPADAGTNRGLRARMRKRMFRLRPRN